MEVKHSFVYRDIPLNIRRQLYGLAFKDGSMKIWLKDFKQNENHGFALWLEKDGVVYSWSCLVQLNNVWTIPYASFYTRKAMRRHGYGTRVYKEVKKIISNFKTFPHDTRSAGFFESVKD